MAGRVRTLLSLTALALCVRAMDAGEPAAPALIIYHAGSISAGLKAVEAEFTKRTGLQVKDVAGGSVSLVRKVTAGGQACDIYAGADVEVIDRMLKPAGEADFSVRIASGAMVLAYSTLSRNAATIAAPGPYAPPGDVPMAAPDWYAQLIQPGVRIGAGHPFLDPGAYRTDLIAQLAQAHYRVPNYYDELLNHVLITGDHGGLGKSFDYQFIYEHGARAAAKADTTGTYRYARLPDEVSLGAPGMNAFYGTRSIPLPGLQTPGSAAAVTLPASRVTWGLTMLKRAPHPENAVAFLKLLFSSEGAAMLNAGGVTAIHPPQVSREDMARLPASLRELVKAE